MEPVQTLLDDPKRLCVLHETGLLDQPAERAFDRLTRLAARTLDVPIAIISLVDKDRQFFKSHVGLPQALAISRQTPLSHSFCKYVVLSGEPLLVEDARSHPVLKNNPVISHGVIAYAGIPLITEDGLILGSFCAIDTKPRAWTTAQIEDLKDFAAAALTEIELRRSNSAKDRFIAMLSHELRTPLSPAMMTTTALMADPELSERAREDVQLIQRNLELQTHMIDALLDVTRIRSGKLHLSKTDVDIHALLHRAAEMFSTGLAGKSLKLGFDLQAERFHVDGDEAKLQQVFCNLLSNAIKFSPSGGTITLGTVNQASDLSVHVTDAGVGISPALLPMVFDSYQQGGTEVTREFGGLGLGLAICRGIVDAHGGQISAASAGHNRGTTMTTLLHDASPPKLAAPPTRVHQDKPERSVSILLVEDHGDTLRIMSRLLRKLEHRVVTANSVATALEAASTTRFDLLISDLGLPDGTGLDLLNQLGTQRPKNGIALTGYGMEEDIQRTKAAGFQRHLTKPIDFAQLQAAIQELEL